MVRTYTLTAEEVLEAFTLWADDNGIDLDASGLWVCDASVDGSITITDEPRPESEVQ